MKIAVGSDHAGFEVKEAVKQRLQAAGHEVVDFGAVADTPRVDYPDYARKVALAVQKGEADRGILACGTGLGMCMTANRFRGVRAADCFTPHLAEMARSHNDANVLCLGGRVLSVDECWAITEVFLATPAESGRHERRAKMIDEMPLE
jgi:ribose 5-phosphate isomerase B